MPHFQPRRYNTAQTIATLLRKNSSQARKNLPLWKGRRRDSKKNIIIMKIRSYSKQELAMLYFPDSDPRTATCHLMRWINRNPTLLQKLKSTGYYRSSKYFTTRQVCMILDYLGDP